MSKPLTLEDLEKRINKIYKRVKLSDGEEETVVDVDSQEFIRVWEEKRKKKWKFKK